MKAEEQVGDGIFPRCVAEGAWALLDLEGLSVKRLVKKKSSLRQSLKGRKTMVVVVGGGLAGVYVLGWRGKEQK